VGTPTGQQLATGIGVGMYAAFNAGGFVQMADSSLAPAGGDQPHNNLQPYLTFYFCIALQGVFPPRG
jgi:microcystin-dependent protein